MDPLVIAIGRVAGTALAVAGWVGTQVVAATVSDPVSAFESTIQWGAIAVLGILLIAIFCFYLPAKDKRVQETEKLFIASNERSVTAITEALRAMEDRYDARSKTGTDAIERIAEVMTRQQGLCAEAHEILRHGKQSCECESKPKRESTRRGG